MKPTRPGLRPKASQARLAAAPPNEVEIWWAEGSAGSWPNGDRPVTSSLLKSYPNS